MERLEQQCPLTKNQILDLYFLEHRAKMIDIAAFLDRLDRGKSDGNNTSDYRITALKKSLSLLLDDQPNRSKRILDCLSDHTTDLPVDAAGTKGAVGAPKELSE